MDTQNVSAQLYFKQLPADNSAANYNCEDTFPNLSTCVDNVQTDAQIENAFQDQLNLSEIYKSPDIFNKVKEQFMDETMEAENTPTINIPQLPSVPSVPIKIPVGPEDFLRRFIKEGFGSTSSNALLFIISMLVIAYVILGIIKGSFNPMKMF